MDKNAKQYARSKYLFFVVDLIVMFTFLLFFQFSGLSRILREEVSFYSQNPFIIVGGYFIFFYLIHYCVMFALNFYKSYVHEHKYDLSNQTVGAWLKDQVKKTLISLVFGLIVIEGFYLCLRRFPGSWWIWAGALWLLFTVILDKVAPVVIFPLFYKHRPLGDDALRERLMQLAKGLGFDIQNVFEINLSKDTNKANAALAGLGKTRRILLADTLLNGYSPDEIEVVMAHELGHHALRHIAKLIVFGGITTFLGLYIIFVFSADIAGAAQVATLADIAAFPLIMFLLSVLILVLMPLQNGFSRYLERQADVFALKITGLSNAFVSAMEKLAQQNLADRHPHWLIEKIFYSHPPIGKRIALAKETVFEPCSSGGDN